MRGRSNNYENGHRFPNVYFQVTFPLPLLSLLLKLPIRELTQPRRGRQQGRHKFAYLIVKNNSCARFARAVFFWHFADVLVLSATWNDLFCSCVDDVTIWWQMLNFVFLSMKRWFQSNSRIVRTHFASVMSLNNWEMITETRSYIFRWRSRCRRPRVCVNSLLVSLRSYDGNCIENVTLKLNFALSSVLRLFHVGHVVQNRRSVLSLAWFSC